MPFAWRTDPQLRDFISSRASVPSGYRSRRSGAPRSRYRFSILARSTIRTRTFDVRVLDQVRDDRKRRRDISHSLGDVPVNESFELLVHDR